MDGDRETLPCPKPFLPLGIHTCIDLLLLSRGTTCELFLLENGKNDEMSFCKLTSLTSVFSFVDCEWLLVSFRSVQPLSHV